MLPLYSELMGRIFFEIVYLYLSLVFSLFHISSYTHKIKLDVLKNKYKVDITSHSNILSDTTITEYIKEKLIA